MDKITHIIASPMKRTMGTALFSFLPALVERGIEVIAWHELREWGSSPCNTGRAVSKLRREWTDLPINLDLLPQGWEYNREFGREERVVRVRMQLRALAAVAVYGGMWNGIEFERYQGSGNVEIAVVSHGGFLSDLADFPSEYL